MLRPSAVISVLSAFWVSYIFASVEIIGGRHLKDIKDKQRHINIIQYSLTKSNGRVSLCTGTLLDQRTMLTAAHCVADMTLPSIAIRNNSLNHPQLRPSPQIAVSRVKMHPGYFTTTLINHIDAKLAQRVESLGPVDIAIVEVFNDNNLLYRNYHTTLQRVDHAY